MKTAKFKYSEQGKGTLYATVTLKNDGKVSVNISNAGHYTSVMRFRAKNLAQEIVKADFKHDAAYDFNEVKSYIDSKLVAELYKHTAELKKLYIEETKKFADRKYEHCLSREHWTTKQWYDEYQLPYKILHEGTDRAFPSLERDYNYKVYSMMLNHQSEVRKILGLGLDKYKANEVKDAERHYEASIEKLSMKLNEKGIVDESEFTVTSGRIGENFECNIHHEHGLTKAWTILASGPIQRPHYRYLVK
jgi:hypothetical protein